MHCALPLDTAVSSVKALLGAEGGPGDAHTHSPGSSLCLCLAIAAGIQQEHDTCRSSSDLCRDLSAQALPLRLPLKCLLSLGCWLPVPAHWQSLCAGHDTCRTGNRQVQTWASRLCLSACPSAASSAWEAGCRLSTASMLWQAAPEWSAAPLAASSAACTSSMRRDTWRSARCSRLCICIGRSRQHHRKHSSRRHVAPALSPLQLPGHLQLGEQALHSNGAHVAQCSPVHPPGEQLAPAAVRHMLP